MKFKKKIIFVILFILLFFGFSYLIFKIPFEEIFSSMGKSGYILISVLSIFGNNIFTSSLLYSILIFLKQSGMNLFLLASFAALGATIGDLIFVFFGQKISESEERENKKILKFFKKHKDSSYIRLFIFLYAVFIPTSNELMTLALGYIKYPIKKIIFPLVFGNLIYYIILILFGETIIGVFFG